MPAVAALTVALFSAGIFMIILGWVGTPISSASETGADRTRFSFGRDQQMRLGVSLFAGIVLGIITGWLGLFAAAMVVTYSLIGLFADRHRRDQKLRRLRAVATWLEMMRDTILAGAGISSAVQMTARRAPELIRPTVRRLNTRLESSSFSLAIAEFGDELDVAEADSGIAALAMASRSAGGNLGQLLTVVVESIRSQVDQAARIEALRLRFVTSATLMVAVTLATSVMFLVSAPQLRHYYDTSLGQLIILIVGGFYAIAINMLRRMASEREPVRLVAGVPA